MEEQWSGIAQEAVVKLERLQCSFAKFVEGLRYVEEDIKERRKLAEAELEAQLDEDVSL